MLLMIDNHDSFTWNLVQYFQELGIDVEVAANDAISLEQIAQKQPDYLVISPGPCSPDEAGISLEVVNTFAGKIPLLGVCLGHQTIAQHFGARIIRARELVHGKTSAVYHENKGIFAGLPSPFQATRYHSLTVEPQSLPVELEVTAWLQEDCSKEDRQLIGDIMGLRHNKLPIEGVQFHPEAILSEHGHRLLRHFIERYAPENTHKKSKQNQ